MNKSEEIEHLREVIENCNLYLMYADILQLLPKEVDMYVGRKTRSEVKLKELLNDNTSYGACIRKHILYSNK